jgi:P-type E1-E2 ATPase
VSIEADIPGFGQLRLEHVALDVNGTLAVEGVLVEGVEARLRELTGKLTVHLLSGDTYGRTDEVAATLGVQATIVSGPDEAGAKRARVRELGSSTVAAIGNGANDAGMLEEAAVGIAVVGAEGAAGNTLRVADLVVTSPLDALDLLLRPARLVAGLRR